MLSREQTTEYYYKSPLGIEYGNGGDVRDFPTVILVLHRFLDY